MKKVVLLLFLTCFGFSQPKKYSAKQIDSIFVVGNNYYKNSDFTSSLKVLKVAFTEAEKLKNDTLIIKICNRLGRNCTQIKNVKYADYFFLRALTIANKIDDIEYQILILNNLGNLYSGSKVKIEQQKGKNYYEKCYKLAKKINAQDDICLISMNLAWYYLEVKDYIKAKPLLDEFTKLQPKYGDYSFHITKFMLMGMYYEGIKDYKNAEKQFEEGLTKFSKKLIFKEDKAVYLAHYAKFLSKIGKYKKAYSLLIEADSINNIFYNKESLKQANQSSFGVVLDSYKKDKEKAEFDKKVQEEKNKSTKILTFIILLFLGITGFYALYVFRINKNETETNKQLLTLNSQLVKAKQDAEISNEVKSKFVSTITHELRTPLYGVIGLSEILEKSVTEKESLHNIKSLKYSAKHLLSLVNDVLQLSKLENKNAKLEFNNFNLRYEIEKVKESLTHIAIQNKNEITIIIPSNIYEVVYSDDVKLSQLLINLTSNALKFTKKGKVNIQLELLSETEKNQTIKFSVIDTGNGISEEDKKQIFDKFFQIKQKNNFYEGTGLGLTIVNDILQMFNSKIDLVSELGKGSTFSFVLVLDKGNLNQEVVQDFSIKNIQNLQILIVDDNKINQIVTSKTVLNIGSLPTVVSSGFEAIQITKNKSFDLILMDINMPEIDGFETTREIRKLNKLVPIVALTAFDKSEIYDKAMQSGMSDILIKPYQTSELLVILSKFQNNKG